MSLKAIEMQIALPRTQDAGRIQEQLNQRPMINQQQMSVEGKQKADLDRKRSVKLDSSSEALISSDEESSRSEYEPPQNKEQKELGLVDSPHPYKGKHIDISL